MHLRCIRGVNKRIAYGHVFVSKHDAVKICGVRPKIHKTVYVEVYWSFVHRTPFNTQMCVLISTEISPHSDIL